MIAGDTIPPLVIGILRFCASGTAALSCARYWRGVPE